ncbi:hypothetical protein Ahy_A05g021813 isoform C [Arachis hypogaea]|uniref:Uncharacterized protein n=1 Tax=Arachis hypogaea TaxID=3818 RepID=A0A445CYJ7_ARAHY|nr:hypothetical protein Ahy_A05g021813 isoform C [Arachis hypogaea]
MAAKRVYEAWKGSNSEKLGVKRKNVMNFKILEECL